MFAIMRLRKLTSILLSALMNSKEAVLRQGKIGHLMITSAQHIQRMFSAVKWKVNWHSIESHKTLHGQEGLHGAFRFDI